MSLLFLLLLHLGLLVDALNFTVVNNAPPWSWLRRAHFSLQNQSLVFHGGWPSKLLDLEPPPAWISPDRGITWHSIDNPPVYRLVTQCIPQDPPIFRRYLTRLDLDSSQGDLNWLAWSTLISQPLLRTDPTDYNSNCLVTGHVTYSLEPLTESVRRHTWQLDMRVPRLNALTGVHFHNRHLQTDIYYVLGGGIPQPDGRIHYLRDLWASADGGRTWTPIQYKYLWRGDSSELSLTISSQGVMLVSELNRRGGIEVIWISLDGGRRWDTCDGYTQGGFRSEGTLGFDAEGYLYVLGGHRSIWPEDNVMRSDFSFHDRVQVQENCGYLDYDEVGLGLKDLRPDEGSWATGPQIGVAKTQLREVEKNDLGERWSHLLGSWTRRLGRYLARVWG